MEQVTLKKMHPTQMQIMVGAARVGYVCFGERQPINFLPPSVVKIKLTDAEKVQVAKQVREQMGALNADRERQSNELEALTSRDFDSVMETSYVSEGGDVTE